MFSIKEKLGNVDMKSAGIGALALAAVEAGVYFGYKGGKCLYNSVKAAIAARKVAKQAQAASEEKEEQK